VISSSSFISGAQGTCEDKFTSVVQWGTHVELISSCFFADDEKPNKGKEGASSGKEEGQGP
jgi:hypothetical protein